MAIINSINNKSSSLTIDPGASGDSAVQLSINTVAKFKIGVDDTDSDAFVISQGSALGTNNVFRIESTGEINLPLQTCFSSKKSSTSSNQTGDGTAFQIVYDSAVRFNIGSDYNSGTGVFTAPCDGKFFFAAAIFLLQMTTSHETLEYKLVTSNRDVLGTGYSSTSGTGLISNAAQPVISAIVDMDEGDTAYIQVTVSGSTKTVDVYGEAQYVSHLEGVLIC